MLLATVRGVAGVSVNVQAMSFCSLWSMFLVICGSLITVFVAVYLLHFPFIPCFWVWLCGCFVLLRPPPHPLAPLPSRVAAAVTPAHAANIHNMPFIGFKLPRMSNRVAFLRT